MRHSQNVAEILACYPGPIELKRSSFLRVLSVAVGILLAVGALRYMWVHPATDGMLIGLPALCIASVIAFVKRTLTLDSAGFEAPYGKRFYWHANKDFRVATAGRGMLLCFNEVGNPNDLVSKIDRATIGRDRSISVPNYGLSLDELAELMNAWRERAMRATG